MEEIDLLIWFVSLLLAVAGFAAAAVVNEGARRALRDNQGMVLWGVATLFLAIALIGEILLGSEAVVKRIAEAGSVLGAIMAASVLAWSVFFQTHGRDLERKIDRLLDRFERRDTDDPSDEQGEGN